MKHISTDILNFINYHVKTFTVDITYQDIHFYAYTINIYKVYFLDQPSNNSLPIAVLKLLTAWLYSANEPTSD